MNAPMPVSHSRRPTDPRGSLMLGVGIAWATLVGGYVAAAVLMTALANSSNDALIVLLVALPWLGMIGWIIYFAMREKPRTAIGVVIGIVSIIAVTLLLIAACFGIFAASGWH
jgi:hypothetical protein